jgi:hypothetical protein
VGIRLHESSEIRLSPNCVSWYGQPPPAVLPLLGGALRGVLLPLSLGRPLPRPFLQAAHRRVAALVEGRALLRRHAAVGGLPLDLIPIQVRAPHTAPVLRVHEGPAELDEHS